MIEDKDMTAIINRMKDIFITRAECENTSGSILSKLSNDDRRMAVIETYQKMILWVLVAVGGGVISMLIKMFFGG